MKTPSSPIAFERSLASRSGIALVIVLAMLVLLSGIMIAFISSANTENVSAKTSAQGLEARQAAETATNFVIAQIREATNDGSGDTTWISQPGAIRTIGSGSASSNKVFKLYSSDEMQTTEGSYKPETQAESGVDPSNPGTAIPGFVDLNEPVFAPIAGSTTTFEPRYPIVSPYGKYAYSLTTKQFSTGSEPTAATAGTGAVEGFYCGGYKDTSHKDANNANIPLLPMRVKWLYILKDGKMVGTNPSGNIIDATAANPPVARTAFWVDDESCKLNINTATEGTYWDTPVVAAVQESGAMDGSGNPNTAPPNSLNLSMAQPTRAEYQRFPGHPATTSLGPAVRWLFPAAAPSDPADIEYKEAIYRLAPRIQETFRNVPSGPDSSRGATLRGGLAAKTRKPDADRLYASVDEYFFRPDRTPRDAAEATTTHSDPPGGAGTKDVANPNFTPENLEKIRFFLTTSSRTPDLNLFGKPRVTTWPIHQTLTQRSAFDDLFDFCSTVGATNGSNGRHFNFLRADPNSPIADIAIPGNLDMYQYLQVMTSKPIPFLGQSFRGKYGAANCDQLLTEIFDYIRSTNLVDTEAGSHGSVIPVRTDGIGQLPSDSTYQLGYTRFFWKDAINNPETSGTSYGSGQVIPTQISSGTNSVKGGNKDTQGFGRFVIPSEVALLFFRVGDQSAAAKVKMQAVLLIDMYSLACGYPGLAERYSTRVRIPGVDPTHPGGVPVPQLTFKITNPAKPSDPDIELGFPADAVNVVDCDSYSGPIGRMFMPSRGFENQFHNPTTNWNTEKKEFNTASTVGAPNPKYYPFFSKEIELPPGTKEFGLKGGSMTIDIHARPKASDAPKPINRINSVTLVFPDNNSTDTSNGKAKNVLPVPASVAGTKSSDFKLRITRGISGSRSKLDLPDGADSGYKWIENGDVIRSMEVGGSIAKGDRRLVATLSEVVQKEALPATNYEYFEPRGNGLTPNPYFDVRNFRVHGLRVGRGGYLTPKSATDNSTDPDNAELVYSGASTKRLDDGVLVTGTGPFATTNNRRTDRSPQLPPGLNGVLNGNGNPGDWDRGISKNVDGPFINRADEGNVNFEPQNGNLGIPYYLGFSGFAEVGPTFFSPNRLMSSPVMFGGLLSRAIDGGPGGGTNPIPWETLLFRPQAFTGEHHGAVNPPDHYLLDLFNMPVVEPYAISEPLSTAGKVNLNYVIAPFGYVRNGNVGAYIERKTSLHGILKAVKLLLVNKTASRYAHGPDDPTQTLTQFRFDLDRVATLKEIENRITTKGLFRTASEICEVPLYPVVSGGNPSGVPSAPASSANAWKTFWENYALTGDNGRERPYSLIYPRVTTKSNVFTAYIRAQSIKKNPNTPVDVFDPAKDQITGEYRGSTTIERFIDPNDPAIANYNPIPDGTGLDPFYRYRIVNTKRFSP